MGCIEIRAEPIQKNGRNFISFWTSLWGQNINRVSFSSVTNYWRNVIVGKMPCGSNGRNNSLFGEQTHKEKWLLHFASINSGWNWFIDPRVGLQARDKREKRFSRARTTYLQVRRASFDKYGPLDWADENWYIVEEIVWGGIEAIRGWVRWTNEVPI